MIDVPDRVLEESASMASYAHHCSDASWHKSTDWSCKEKKLSRLPQGTGRRRAGPLQKVAGDLI